MRFKEEPLIIKIYVTVVVFLSLLFLLFNIPSGELWPWPLLFFIILHLILEQLDIPLPRGNGTVSVSFASHLATVILFGPAAAAWASLTAILEIRVLKTFHRMLFNAAQLAISTGLAGYAYIYTGGTIGQLNLPHDFIPLLACIITYFLINTTLVMIVISFSQGMSLTGVWLTNMRWAVPNFIAISPLGVLFVAVFNNMGYSGIFLLIIPLMVARHTFHLYNDMRNQYLSTIKALTKAIDAKDHYTHGHSERVARYTVMIGKELRLSEDFLEQLEYLALMHDIGKIAIPEHILNKPSKLSDEEFNIVRNHAAVGAEIISNIKFIGEHADIVRHHHERIDGRGYPDGLKGDQLSLGAKIVGVADSFDAMTSTRVYRTPLTLQEAVEELQCCCDSQFCQEIVSAFIKALQRRGEIS